MAKNSPRRFKAPQKDVIFDAPPSRRDKVISPRNENQAVFLHELQHRDLIFAIGPAGTGKTFLGTHYACEMLKANKIKKIIITRPMVTSEEEMGALPGTVEEKFAPFFAPIREIMIERMGKSHMENLIRNERIEMAPIAFLRGHTFKNAFVIFDEAQNTTPKQMQLFLTRIGENAKVCVSGDLDQVDIHGPSGLEDAIRRFGHLPEVGKAIFEVEDVVRSGLAKKIVEGYR